MKDNTSIFKALSDSNRLRILKMLQKKPLCVCEIREILQLASSTVSEHLSILKKLGFIYEKRDGKWINYFINTKPKDRRISAILSAFDFWIDEEETISRDMIKVFKIDRNKINL